MKNWSYEEKLMHLKNLKMNKFGVHDYSKNQRKEEHLFISSFNESHVHTNETIYAQQYRIQEKNVINDSPLCFDPIISMILGNPSVWGIILKKG